MCCLIPRIHAFEDRFDLMNDDDGTLGNGLQVGIGNNHGHLEDPIGVRMQSAHFHVDPNQIIVVGGERPRAGECG